MLDRRIHGGLLLALAMGCGHDARDNDCSPDDPSITVSDRCIFADGQGPQLNDRCQPLRTSATERADPAFSEIADLMHDPERGNCTDTSCHGHPTAPQAGISLPPRSDPPTPDDDDALYQALLEVTGLSVPRPYVIPGNPEATWMHCNLRVNRPPQNLPFDQIVGTPMPFASEPVSIEDLLLVEDWVFQGAKGPE